MEGFRGELEQIRDKPRKSNAGRKPFDVVVMFKVLVLQQMYNLGDDQTEYQIRDRYSFCRFLGLTPEGRVPDAKTIWLFREQLVRRELIESLFAGFSSQIETAGYQARKGQIVDASIVSAPKQRNGREENAQIKAGKPPEDWSGNKRPQKDIEARWTKKHGKSYYGYKSFSDLLKDAESRGLLIDVLHDIEAVLERSEPGTVEEGESLIDRLRETTSHFEKSHPTLTEAVGRIADVLSRLGI